MIKQLKGKVIEKGENTVVLEVNGIGFEIIVDESCITSLSCDEDVVLKTVLVWGDEPKLYGFCTEEKREVFLKLLSVSKLGPKTAIKILSRVSVGELVKLIVTGDVDTLAQLPGVGRKTADRIIAELKDRLELPSTTEDSRLKDFMDAVEALKSLGYTQREAMEAVEKAKDKAENVADLIKEALQVLMMRR